jgi:RNA polymerase sigma-70 factor (ECF subfamily)
MAPPDNDTGEQEERLASYAPRVFGLLVRMVGNRDTAEDLTQETLLRAFRARGAYRPEGKFQAWIFRIATNAARDWLRRRPHEPALGLETDTSGAAHVSARRDAAPETGLVAGERASRVEAALARLPAADREVLLLRYYGDFAFNEIAKVTGEPLGTVLARAHRALKKLAELVPREEP